MKTLSIIWGMAAILALACNPKKEEPVPEPDPVITIPAESQAVFTQGISLDAEVSASIPQVEFAATAAWRADVTDTKASAWLSVEPTSGKAGTIILTVTALPNEGKADREASVTLTCGKDVHKFTVSQAGVPDIAVDSISLDKTELALVEEEKAIILVTVKPDNATDKTITWASSNNEIVTVHGGTEFDSGIRGYVLAVKEGTATITAHSGEKTATCTVTVSKKVVPVTSVELDRHELTLVEGTEADLKATVLPEDATDPSVTWSTSEASVATVEEGKVKALKPGRTLVIAQAGELADTCEVTVEKRFIEVTSVTLNEHTLTLVEGDETTLTVTVKPDDATEPTVTWSTSDATVATVTDGKVKTLKSGKVTITAQAGEKSDACEITVEKRFIAVTSVELNEYKLTLTEGDETTLSATVKPDEATDKAVSWSTSDASVATVSEGKVKTLKPGKVTITAQAGDKSDACEITVEKRFIPVTSVTLNEHTLTLVEGDETTLTAMVKPDDASEPAVSWSTSDASVATVTDGKVRTLKPGTVTITARAGEQSDACAITVEKRIIAVTSVVLSQSELTLLTENDALLTTTVYPENATDKTVTWSSSNPSVASVSNGLISGLKEGETVITAAAGDVSATCKVTVQYQFSISPRQLSVAGDGQEFTVKVKCPETYQVESKPAWITQLSVSGKTHKFKVGRNPAKTQRSGDIVFLDGRGTRLTCTVTQGGYTTEYGDGGTEKVGEGEEIEW